jgi:hypothetical protein
MTSSPEDAQDVERYRVYLLRFWRDDNGPWHASLQAANAATPHRFADREALLAFLRELELPAAGAAPHPAELAEPDGGS